MNDAYGQKALNTELLNLTSEKTRHTAVLKQQAAGSEMEAAQAIKRVNELAHHLAQAQAALAEANAVVADWQSAMEAWKDLAITLREEIKACPNHEAHQFGKADKAVLVEHMNKKEDEERVKRNLKPKYKKT